MNNSYTQKHTHLQAAQNSRTDQSLQKSVLFSSPNKLKNKKFPSLLKNKTSQTHSPRQTDTNIHGDTDDRRAATNSTYKKLAVQWLNEVLCFVSSFVVADSFVLRNRQLLVAANRQAAKKQPSVILFIVKCS